MAQIGVVKVAGASDASYNASTYIGGLINPVIAAYEGTTGVTRTFSPDGVDINGVARWVDRSGGISVGYPTLTMSVRKPTKGSRVYKVTVKLDLPTLETISNSTVTGILPAPQRAYSTMFVGEFLLHERSSQAERRRLFDNVLSLFAATITASDGNPSDATGSPLSAAVTLTEPVWG